MKNISLLLCVMLQALAAFGQNQKARAAVISDSVQTGKLEQIIETVGRKYSPDKRKAIFKAYILSGNPLEIAAESTSLRALSYLKELLEKSHINALVKDSILPSAALEGNIYGVVRLSVANNRSVPGHASEMVTQSLMGTPVEILKKERGYYLVRTPDGYLSWTDDFGIVAMDRENFEKWQQTAKVVFTERYGVVSSLPTSTSLPVSDLVSGDILHLVKEGKPFSEVSLPDGRRGFVLSKSLERYTKWISRPNPDAMAIVNTAKTFLGVPYLWGGTSVKGVDCSGFTKTCFFLNGIILERDASQQALTGEKVDIYDKDSVSIKKCLQNLKPGDLLFFGNRRNGSGTPRVIHTAIYLGGGEFIQSAGMVRINSLLSDAPNFDAYQSRSLLSARRILTAIGGEGITRIDHHPLYLTEIKN